MVHFRVELWDLDYVKNDYLSRSKTDEKGCFEIVYDPSDAGWQDNPDILIRVTDKEFSYTREGMIKINRNVVFSSESIDNVEADVYDLGVIRVPYWEYANKDMGSEAFPVLAFTPRVAASLFQIPQSQRPGWKVSRASKIATYLPLFTKHALANKINDNKPTLKQIAKDYPKNLTQSDPTYYYSDEYLVELILNGFNPVQLMKNDDGEFYVAYKWNGFEQDGKHFAPNTTAFFALEDGKLKIQRITMEKRVNNNGAPDADYEPPVEYKPEDQTWERVKRIFRINYFVFGEAITHLGSTHLNLEQYIIPIMRNIQDNPVRRLLAPHFYGTVSINFAANSTLISGIGSMIPNDSAVTEESLANLVSATFCGFNWYGWKPREPIADGHKHAEVSKVFWELVIEYVDWFFSENEPRIKENWIEIYNMSEELLAHAHSYTDQGEDLYVDKNEINTRNKPHPVIDRKTSALSPVTLSKTVDDEGWENLKQLCRYLVFHATFMHSWINDKQYDIGGDMNFASLGIYGDITDMAVDDERVVPPIAATKLHFIVLLLQFTEYGYILKNEANDMSPNLIQLLNKKKEKFDALGYDVSNIRCCLNA